MNHPKRCVLTAEPTGGHMPANPQWLTIFNDLITLLMVFFVLLFSMGNVDSKRFGSFQNALQSAIGILHEGTHSSTGIMTAEPSSMDAAAQSGKIEASIREAGLEAAYTPKGIQLTLNDYVLFETASARLTPGGMHMLDKVCTIIKPLKRSVRVEGHTDNVPIETPQYQTNWDLSAARAISVVKYMIAKGGFAPRRMSAAGYGASRPRVSNNSAENRAKNRRVEIILEPTTFTAQQALGRHNGGK
jgi:chemotaxis protein MotB